MRGRKPIPTVIKFAKGTLRKSRMTSDEPQPFGKPVMPTACSRRAKAIWSRLIEPAFWLSHFDAQKAFMLCELAAEFERDSSRMSSARIGQLRGVSADLGFDRAARSKLGITAP
jgi:hypothetical protein